MNAAASATDDQSRAIAYPFDAASLAIAGPPGTGKSLALIRRALRAHGEGRTVLLSAASERGVAQLRERLDGLEPLGRIRCEPIDQLAFGLVRRHRREREPACESVPIDDVAAARVLEEVGLQLFSLEWSEFISSEIDPEITGMRAPERFAAAAYRLIRKLRAALISPQDFRAACFRGATAFYGKPPNFSSPELFMDTQQKYRDSLHVTPAELARQHSRELDLIKILVRLYEAYAAALWARGLLTPVEALYQATHLLREVPSLREPALGGIDVALIDDAQDLVPAQFAFLQALFGERLHGVTFAGDEGQATRTFAGARPDQAFGNASETITLTFVQRGDPAIVRAAAQVVARSSAAGAAPVEFYRAESLRDEARFVAATAAARIAAGTPPGEIAVIVRNLRCAQGLIDALLARNIPVDVAGEMNLYEFAAAQDGLAALSALADPYRHDRLLRNLEAPWLNLSDASIAQLCGEPPDAQAMLFELPDDEIDETQPRWDRKRDLRLGRNVVYGEADAGLSDEARQRIGRFRGARQRWEQLERRLDLRVLARTILEETVLATAGNGARGRFTGALVCRLMARIDAFVRRRPLATLDDFLAEADAVAQADPELVLLEPGRAGCVRVLDVEAAKGAEFDCVFLPDVRAGAFPRYYVPEAFLFTPRYGMIPKENVGDARSARTAKFTYVLFRLKTRERYYAEERRAFYCATTRARERLYVSASGRPTKGMGAPELLEELRGGLTG